MNLCDFELVAVVFYKLHQKSMNFAEVTAVYCCSDITMEIKLQRMIDPAGNSEMFQHPCRGIDKASFDQGVHENQLSLSNRADGGPEARATEIMRECVFLVASEYTGPYDGFMQSGGRAPGICPGLEDRMFNLTRHTANDLGKLPLPLLCEEPLGKRGARPRNQVPAIKASNAPLQQGVSTPSEECWPLVILILPNGLVKLVLD